MKPIFTLLFTLFAVNAYAQNADPQVKIPELKELEKPLLQNCKAYKGLDLTECLIDEVLALEKSVQEQFKDDCHWNVWKKEVTNLCFEKAQYEGHGDFLARSTTFCLIAQNLLLYKELLDRKMGGSRTMNELLLDLIGPDTPQLLPLQQLRTRILDNSKEIACAQKPMA